MSRGVGKERREFFDSQKGRSGAGPSVALDLREREILLRALTCLISGRKGIVCIL